MIVGYASLMAYDPGPAGDIRMGIGDHPGLSEREMSGGIAFVVNGDMAVGVSGNELVVRVGRESHDEAVSLPGARTFDPPPRPRRRERTGGPR